MTSPDRAILKTQDWTGGVYRHYEIDHPAATVKIGARFDGDSCPACPPADDPPCKSIDDEGDIDEARPRGDIGEVGNPKHVRRRRLELAVDVIERTRCGLVAHRGPILRIRRATMQRAMSKPSCGNCRQRHVQSWRHLPCHLPSGACQLQEVPLRCPHCEMTLAETAKPKVPK